MASMLIVAMSHAIERTSAATAVQSIAHADGWLNSDGLRAEELSGKVVLVDFWTYTCVNWLRTLPYLRAFEEKYRERGLVVIGVHSPEFGFEADIDNVRRAAQHLGVDYPIALDSHHAIWRAYDNHYWPAVYLIDGKGRVRFRHFGEADYAGVEHAIQQLLAENGQSAIAPDLVSVDSQGAEAAADWDNLQSSENYLGYLWMVGFASPQAIVRAQPGSYTLPRALRLNNWALAGEWVITPEFIRLNHPRGRIAYRFHARDVNLVMGAARQAHAVRFRVLIDGKPPGTSHGADTNEQGLGTVSEPRLFQLVRQSGPIIERQFEIEFLDENAEAFSFTFG